MVSVLDFVSSGPGSSPGPLCCVLRQDTLGPCYTRQYSLQLATQLWLLKNIASCRGGVTRS